MKVITHNGKIVITPNGKALIPQHGGGRLPAGYTEAEWIGSNGTQYIKTGITGGFTVSIVCQLMSFTGITSSAYAAFYGSQNGSSPYNAAFLRIETSSAVFATWSSGNVTFSRTLSTMYVDADCYDTYKSATFNGTRKESSISATYNPHEIYLFALNSAGNASDKIGEKRIYSVKFYGDLAKTNLTRWFVPCYRVSDNEIGMYDLCGSICPLTNSPFYINAGTGTFTKGSDVISPEDFLNELEAIL